MTPFEILGSVVAFGLGSMLQSAVGFGAGMLSIPLLLWVGLPLERAVAMMLGVITIHAGYNCYRARADIVWRPILPISLLRFSAMPVGVWLLERYLINDQAAAKQAVGAVLLLSIAATANSSKTPRGQVHWGWLWLAGLCSGLLAGSVGMGGPPLILYALAHDWSAARTRAYLWTLFLFGAPMTIAIFIWRFGGKAAGDWVTGMAHLPVIWLGSNAGLWLTRRHSRQTLRLLSLTVLCLIAISSIVAPWL